MSSLNHHHLKSLVDSAISEEVIAARGWKSITAAECPEYGFQDYQCASGLLVPSYGCDGELKGHQLRADEPRINKNGKPVKYDTPTGTGNFLDVNPLMNEWICRADQIIYITEGAKKVDSLASHGYIAIGLKGIYGWRGKNQFGVTTALGDWHDVAIKSNHFRIAFDSDIKTNINILNSAKELTNYLNYKQAKSVEIIYLPYEGHEKKGIDDWFADKDKGLL